MISILVAGRATTANAVFSDRRLAAQFAVDVSPEVAGRGGAVARLSDRAGGGGREEERAGAEQCSERADVKQLRPDVYGWMG